MGYASIDCVDYRIVWVPANDQGTSVDITNYVTSHTANESLNIQNDKVDLQFKLIRDTMTNTGVLAPFFVQQADGSSQLKTDSILRIYVKYVDGPTSINTNSQDDLLKTYYVTNWDVSEPDEVVTISAVSLQYKVVNKVISKVYGTLYNGTPTSATGTTFTDSGASFKTGTANSNYEQGLYYYTLELVDNSGNVYNYLITGNTATTCTTHTTIASPSGGGWASYRIGWSSPQAIYDAIQRTSKSERMQGQDSTQVKATRVTDVGNDYTSGIQMLRDMGSGATQAFPIIDIGEAFMPVYKLIQEASSIAACNTSDEIVTRTPPILRDMIDVITWDSATNQYVINWYYAAAPNVVDTDTISSISGSVITVGSGDSGNLGKLVKISFVRNGLTYSRKYTITAIAGNDYTLSSNAESDGILAGDSIVVYGAVDFIWDNDEDWKHIYAWKLGAKDEEKFNHIAFNGGANRVAGTDVIGHWFNERTSSDSLKETMIPMTNVGKKMMNYCIKTDPVIRQVDDGWEGADGIGGWTSTGADWDFTTTFGTGVTYTIASRTDFNTYFRTADRLQCYRIAESLSLRQKENTLTGTFTVRGQRFTKLSSGSEAIKWYRKGTKILFKRPESALANNGGTYYTLVVTKIRHQIDATSWTTFMDVEYDLYNTNELI